MTYTISSLLKQFVITIILFSFCTPALAAEYISIKKDGVNIRSGPSTKKTEILWEVFKDFPLQVVKRKGDWIQAKDFEGDQGWVFANLAGKNKRVIVKVNTANMRTGPGKDFELVATVKYGVVFTPKEKDGDWIQVRHEDGTSGWIYNKLIWPSNPF